MALKLLCVIGLVLSLKVVKRHYDCRERQYKQRSTKTINGTYNMDKTGKLRGARKDMRTQDIQFTNKEGFYENCLLLRGSSRLWIMPSWMLVEFLKKHTR